MFGFLPSIGPWELMLILGIALIIFGPGKLPEVGKAIGKGLREFKSAASQVTDQINTDVIDQPKPPAASQPENTEK